MRVNLLEQLLDMDSQPATQTSVKGYDKEGKPSSVVEIPITLAYAIKTALNVVEKEQTPEVSFKRGGLIVKINKALSTGLEEDNPDFTAEEISDINKMVVKVWSPVICYQVSAILKP